MTAAPVADHVAFLWYAIAEVDPGFNVAGTGILLPVYQYHMSYQPHGNNETMKLSDLVWSAATCRRF